MSINLGRRDFSSHSRRLETRFSFVQKNFHKGTRISFRLFPRFAWIWTEWVKGVVISYSPQSNPLNIQQVYLGVSMSEKVSRQLLVLALKSLVGSWSFWSECVCRFLLFAFYFLPDVPILGLWKSKIEWSDWFTIIPLWSCDIVSYSVPRERI